MKLLSNNCNGAFPLQLVGKDECSCGWTTVELTELKYIVSLELSLHHCGGKSVSVSRDSFLRICILTLNVLDSKFCLQPHFYHLLLRPKTFSPSPILSFEIPLV